MYVDYDRLNIPLIKKWIEALRSPGELQGKGFLEYYLEGEDKPRRCCLGVLCRVAMAEGLQLNVIKYFDDVRDEKTVITFSGNDFVLPVDVVKLMGFTDDSGNLSVYVTENGIVRECALTFLNDGKPLYGSD